MELRQVGDTGLLVSVIGLDCGFGGAADAGQIADADAVHLMRCAYFKAISFFDSGDACDSRRTESMLGQFLKTVPRGEVQIGCKFGYDFSGAPGEKGSYPARKQDFSPAFLRTALEESLRRLGTDYIDLYMAQDIKLPQFGDDLFAELENVKRQGMIRAWGVSLGPEIGWREEGFAAMLDHHASAVQTVFNLFEQNPGREICELARSQHAAVLARGRIGRSIPQDTPTPGASTTPDDTAGREHCLKKSLKVSRSAQARKMSLRQLECRWLLQQPGLASITATLRTEGEITEAAESVEMPGLTQRELTELATDYARDWGLGEAAHPRRLKSSVDASGSVRSRYVPPPTMLA